MESIGIAATSGFRKFTTWGSSTGSEKFGTKCRRYATSDAELEGRLTEQKGQIEIWSKTWRPRRAEGRELSGRVIGEIREGCICILAKEGNSEARSEKTREENEGIKTIDEAARSNEEVGEVSGRLERKSSDCVEWQATIKEVIALRAINNQKKVSGSWTATCMRKRGTMTKVIPWELIEERIAGTMEPATRNPLFFDMTSIWRRANPHKIGQGRGRIMKSKAEGFSSSVP